MTLKILKSQVAQIPNFEVRVAEHVQLYNEHKSHMERVASDEKAGIEGIAKHEPYPASRAHKLIEDAINYDTGKADYIIENDDPTPAEILDQKKNDLFHQVSLAEQDAINKIFPPRTHRSLNIREHDIRQRDIDRGRKISQSYIAKAKSILGGPSIEEQIASARSQEDADFLKEHEDRQNSVQKILRSAASAHSEIDALTIDTIDSWKIPDFSK